MRNLSKDFVKNWDIHFVLVEKCVIISLVVGSETDDW